MTRKLPLLDTERFIFSKKHTRKRFGVNLNINFGTYRVIPKVFPKDCVQALVFGFCAALLSGFSRLFSHERLNYEPAGICLGRSVTCLSHRACSQIIQRL